MLLNAQHDLAATWQTGLRSARFKPAAVAASRGWIAAGRHVGRKAFCGMKSTKPTYPANLCPLFGCAEFACYCEDLGETVGEARKTAARSDFCQGAPEHLYQVLSGQ